MTRWNLSLCLGFAVMTAAAVSSSLWAQQLPDRSEFHHQPGTVGPEELRALDTSAAAAPDPCIDCNVIYAGDCAGSLWSIDTSSGTSTLIGSMPDIMFDIAISSDRRLFGISGFGDIYEVSACDGSGTLVRAGTFFANGLEGDATTTDLFSQGPPLHRIETSSVFPATSLGGTLGSSPPDWCGGSSGDLALNPNDGLLYSSLQCVSICFGDILVSMDPATGDVLSEIGCIATSGGIIGDVFGLAFDGAGSLWGAIGAAGSDLLLIDPATADATAVPISGGFSCAFGLAACSQLQQPAICPHSQGFWKNHPQDWPVTTLTLGAEDYDQAEMLELLKAPVRGDASLILAKQLIAAKLNIANGSNPVPADPTIADADAILAGFPEKLPYGVHLSTPDGQAMTSDGKVLDEYNSELLTPGCIHSVTQPSRREGGGGCAGAFGVSMAPTDIFGTMAPFLALALALFVLGLRSRCRQATVSRTERAGLVHVG